MRSHLRRSVLLLTTFQIQTDATKKMMQVNCRFLSSPSKILKMGENASAGHLSSPFVSQPLDLLETGPNKVKSFRKYHKKDASHLEAHGNTGISLKTTLFVPNYVYSAYEIAKNGPPVSIYLPT